MSEQMNAFVNTLAGKIHETRIDMVTDIVDEMRNVAENDLQRKLYNLMAGNKDDVMLNKVLARMADNGWSRTEKFRMIPLDAKGAPIREVYRLPLSPVAAVFDPATHKRFKPEFEVRWMKKAGPESLNRMYEKTWTEFANEFRETYRLIKKGK